MTDRGWLIVLCVAVVALVGCGAGPEPEARTQIEVMKPVTAADLEGTGWQARSIAGQTVADDVRSTIVLEADNRVAGFGGCNSFFGSWAVEDDAIVFGHLGATMMMCPPEIMEQETGFLEALNTAERFEIISGELVIHSAGADQPTVFEAFEARRAITGVVLYRERIALPPGARITVRLVDVSRADAPATVLGEDIIDSEGQVPVAFKIDYDPALIDDRMRYAIEARIEVDGELRFITTEAHPVLTDGHPADNVEVVVHGAGP
jgi:putative lipoprotein